MNRNLKWILLVAFVVIAILVFFITRPAKMKSYSAMPGEVVELRFELDKKFEFGEYYFELDNGKKATLPLCYCLTEKNTYPPDCTGNVRYIYRNSPGTMCMPMTIGRGSCAVPTMSSSSYATMFLIPLEYGWTKPFEKIVMGVQVPENTRENARIVVSVQFFKRNDLGKLEKYRNYEQAITVRHR